MPVADRILNSARRRFRVRRAELFLRLIQPHESATILDLGGSTGDFAALIAERRPDLRFTIADTEPTRLIARERHGFAEAALDPEGPLPFADGAFDVVLCNSVIEHVTLPRHRLNEVMPERVWREESLRRQAAFAAEIARVGRRYFVQTPHRAFPIDVHLWLPLTGYLSHDAARRLVRWTDRYWIKKTGFADWHLLGPRELARLFPGAALHVERVLAVPKSLIAWR